MNWIDAHAHLSFFKSEDLIELISQAESKNLRNWVLGGYDKEDWQRQGQLKQQFHGKMKICYGLHPWRVLELSSDQIDEQLAILSGVLSEADACGETGIDGLRGKTPESLEKQEDVFVRHLELNLNYGKPLVLHVVRHHARVQDILSQYSFTGIVHGYSGSYEDSLRYVKMGFMISIGKAIYVDGYKGLKECAKRLPLENIVLESDADSGDQDVVSMYLRVAQAVAGMRNMKLEELMEHNYKNVQKVFSS